MSRMVRRKTRRTHGRRTRRRRAQKGGGILGKIKFRFFEPKEDGKINMFSQEEMTGKERGHITMLTGEAPDETIYCELDYVLLGEGVHRVAYLENIMCYEKIENFGPLSYLIVNKLMELLEASDIKYIYLRVAANKYKEDGLKFYRLYELYRTMGFYCLPNIYTPETEEQSVEDLYKEMKGADDFLKTARKPKTKANVNRLHREYQIDCGKMIGSVSEIKEILEQAIHEMSSIKNLMNGLNEA